MLTAAQNILNRIARWVVLSSANPSQVSLTVKAVLVAALPYVMLLVGAGHWNVGQDQVSMAINAVSDIIFYLLSATAAIMGALGVGRKLILSLNGHNDVNK